MTFHDLLLKPNSLSGDALNRQLVWMLTTTNEDLDTVLAWLGTDAPAAAFDGVVQRPDGRTLTQAELAQEADKRPILGNYDARSLGQLSAQQTAETTPQYWDVTASYSDAPGPTGFALEPGDYEANAQFSYEIGPPNAELKVSLGTVATRPPVGGGAAPDSKRFLQLNAESEPGSYQVPDPSSQFSLLYKNTPAWFTLAKRVQISRQAGTVNSTPFLGFSAGEVRFLGASGQIDDAGDSTVSLRFGVAENYTISAADLAEMGLSGDPLNVEGFDLFWLWPAKGSTAGLSAPQVRGGYVDRILRRSDLDALFT